MSIIRDIINQMTAIPQDVLDGLVRQDRYLNPKTNPLIAQCNDNTLETKRQD